MAVNSFVLISNTGSLGGALKLAIVQDSWRVWTEDSEVFTGLDGGTTIGIGARTGKLRWTFTGLVQKVGASGYVSLDGSGQTVFQWAASTTAAQRLLKFQDVFGAAYDVVWKTGFKPVPVTGGMHGTAEWHRINVELWQA